jgi:hypothetical protein
MLCQRTVVVAGDPQLKMYGLLCIVILVVAFAVASTAQDVPLRPIYTIDLSSLVPQDATSFQGTVVFLGNQTLAVSICGKVGCNLATFDFSDGKIRQIAQVHEVEHGRSILRASDGGVLLTAVRRGKVNGVVHLSRDLLTSQWIPTISGVSVTGEKIPNGNGRLLAHSPIAAAYLDQGIVRIQGMDGKLLGSFTAGIPSDKFIPAALFLGSDRLWFQRNGAPDIRDFNGKVLLKLDKPDGWGGRMGKSDDGTRLMYDRFTRHVGLMQAITEDALILPTMGMSADGNVPNGEMVSVIDTVSGKHCFEWKGKEKLLSIGGYHADIDPSGRLVAIMTQSTLAIYRLPDICARQ